MDKLLNMESKQISYLLLGVFILAMLIFLGCSVQKEPVIPEEPVEYSPVVEDVEEEEVLKEVTEEMYEEEPVVEVEEEPEYKTIDEKIEERDVTPIGNRVWETEDEEVEEEVIEAEEEIMIYLLDDKTMTKSAVSISAGTTLTWKNQDPGFVHIMLIEEDKVRIGESPRLQPDDKYSYTFNDKGDYLIRDVFSGTMRMTVAVS
ncbi:hypothetical protein ACFL96_09130 [Thermoproteota archaeon]